MSEDSHDDANGVLEAQALVQEKLGAALATVGAAFSDNPGSAEYKRLEWEIVTWVYERIDDEIARKSEFVPAEDLAKTFGAFQYTTPWDDGTEDDDS